MNQIIAKITGRLIAILKKIWQHFFLLPIDYVHGKKLFCFVFILVRFQCGLLAEGFLGSSTNYSIRISADNATCLGAIQRQ